VNREEVEKYPPEVGAELTVDEFAVWCLSKAYSQVVLDGGTVLLFCHADGDFKVCVWKAGEGGKSVVKVDERTLSIADLRSLIGSLKYLKSTLVDYMAKKREKLTRETG